MVQKKKKKSKKVIKPKPTPKQYIVPNSNPMLMAKTIFDTMGAFRKRYLNQ